MKRPTKKNRVARRMKVNGVDEARFFRDRAAFEALEQIITPLFANKKPREHVRVWIPACATGEEAYSIAMLLYAHAETLATPPTIQIFGSDLDTDAIHTARDGVYSQSIANDVDEQRLRGFFTRETGGYRVRREVRELMLFAKQDLRKDPPFSRMDLICCRNLADVDDRLQQVFHFALKPRGLLLGKSAALATSALFHVVDDKHHVYARRAIARSAPPREPRRLAEHQSTLSEELKASNEELQATTEELRSTTEELKTSRDELQSMNQELTSVNQEMSARLEALATVNADLQNLLSATSIATVFLDTRLAIMRYTALAAPIFHLIPSDIGRPLAHLRSELDYPELLADAEKVHDALVPIEREVTSGARSFLSRLQPYRTLDNRIGGVVLTLVDVTERNLAREARRLSEARLNLILESAKDYAIFTLDPDRRVESWSAGAALLFGFSEDEVVGKLVDELFTAAEREASVPQREMAESRATGSVGRERWYTRKDGGRFFGSGAMVPLREGGVIKGYVSIMRDLTTTKHTQDELREHANELARFNAAAVGREERMIDLKKEINVLATRLGEPARYKVED